MHRSATWRSKASSLERSIGLLRACTCQEGGGGGGRGRGQPRGQLLSVCANASACCGCYAMHYLISLAAWRQRGGGGAQRQRVWGGSSKNAQVLRMEGARYSGGACGCMRVVQVCRVPLKLEENQIVVRVWSVQVLNV